MRCTGRFYRPEQGLFSVNLFQDETRAFFITIEVLQKNDKNRTRPRLSEVVGEIPIYKSL